MDSFSGKSAAVRSSQLGRHLAETPYTSSGSEQQGAACNNIRSEGELKRCGNAASAGSDSGRKASRDFSNASGGPRFVDAAIVINDNDGPVAHSEYVSEYVDDPEGSGHSKFGKRVLTQRYQLDEMRVIRKRISAEDWICEQIDRLNAKQQTAHDDRPAGEESANVNTEPALDLDELLGCGGDTDRRAFLEVKLRNCPAQPEDIEAFISECIERIRPL